MVRNRKQIELFKKKSKSRFGRIIIVTGARQTGKTTLVKNGFKDYTYISIEDPIAVSKYKNLTASQWNSLFPKAILDEIQKEPQIIESIKAVYDQYDEPRYVLLGSLQIMLLKKVKESLAGRSMIFELFPLTIPESLTKGWNDKIIDSYFQNVIVGNEEDLTPIMLDTKYSQKKNTFNNYLKFGAYPAISDDKLKDEEKYEWLFNYVKTYFERDIRDIAEIKKLELFTKTQKLLALNTAQLTNYSKLAVEAGVTSKTAQRFLEYSNISYQTITLQAWSRNQRKKLVKSPKVHFVDVGVLRTILNKKDELTGHEFESAIIAEIYKQVKTMDLHFDFYHLRTADGKEIDLLIETEKGYIAFEIKQSENVRSVDARHLRNIEEILDKPVLHKFLLSNDEDVKYFDGNVIAMSALQFLT
jgi:predicted AAA+ superfamily ATPase